MSNEENSQYTGATEETSVDMAEGPDGETVTKAEAPPEPRRDESRSGGKRGGYGRSYKKRRAEEVIDPELEELISKVIGAAIEVHKALGPGLDHDVYLNALELELKTCDVDVERDHPFEITYREQEVGKGNIDLLVDESLVVAVKTVHRLTLFDKSQMLSNLRAAELDVGLMLNFHAPLMKDGLQRVIL